METTIKDFVRSQPQLQAAVTENYDHIELTEEEVQSALRDARRKKDAKLREEAYWKRVSTPVEYPKMNAEDLGRWVRSKIRQAVPEFVIDDNNRHIFKFLCYFFSGDERFESEAFSMDEAGNAVHLSLKKGIALMGPVGCGKTTLLRGFKVNPVNSFVEVSCRTVASEYSDKEIGGPHTIQYYSSLREVYAAEYFGQRQVGTFFDDLGTERNRKHMGNESNVMEEIILNRYDNLSLRGKTHITGNISGDNIDELYGSRVRSRMRDMFNWITFDTNSPDRRK